MLSGTFAWADELLDVSQTGEFRRVAGLWVSGDLFNVLGVRPVLGKIFTAADDYRGCGADADVILSVNGRDHRVPAKHTERRVARAAQAVASIEIDREGAATSVSRVTLQPRWLAA
jgi:hypothetical protein